MTHPAVLKTDTHIKAILANQDLAVELVSGLSHVTWTDGQSLSCMSYVEAGNSIASLRGKGECYSDLVLDSRLGFVTESVWELMDGYGWYPLNPNASPENPDHVKSIMEECEVRDYRMIQPWVYYRHDAPFAGDDLISRMNRCCFSSQVTLTEWEIFYLNIPTE